MLQRFCLIIAHISIILLISVPSLFAADNNPIAFEEAFEINPLRQIVAAPKFEAVDLDGKAHRLSDFRNRTVIVNFWATWCLPCIRELPRLEKLQQMIPADKYVILAINVRDRLSRVRKFLKGKNFQFKVLFDTDGLIYKAYDVTRFPTTVIIGPDGKLLAEVFGERDWSLPGFVTYLDYLSSEGKGEKG
ncbi:MAG: TlpA family protein disulfide reductase [Deltaproteobacteria bacterium]|jgi:peroxiredoxin|nr:TlpA family protein disulfide reductase [Deltaproteobacteria bacterium]MBT4263311.1 TlpA family protein disulfide reductase [Deltaproteobacteria bacterium]MBT4641544.1 TlpA family protein disulfide reductase [Deltaproteobacteria bacterium]MBT6503384.1 TlpA family protein disulfide reductase [Deltaproteobacteria bacterium]MBT7154823.1 TlpA family protein disulfide reductase [Deltaproteobacteria bacterium]